MKTALAMDDHQERLALQRRLVRAVRALQVKRSMAGVWLSSRFHAHEMDPD